MVFDTVLAYGHESWVMTERMLSQVQAAEMGSLKKVESVTLRDKVQSCELSKNPRVTIFRIERSQVHWFDHVARMSQGGLERQDLLAIPMGM